MSLRLFIVTPVAQGFPGPSVVGQPCLILAFFFFRLSTFEVRPFLPQLWPSTFQAATSTLAVEQLRPVRDHLHHWRLGVGRRFEHEKARAVTIDRVLLDILLHWLDARLEERHWIG